VKLAQRLIVVLLALGPACSQPAAKSPSHGTTTGASAPQRVSSRALAVGAHGAVASAEQAASDVGRAVLERGGNAVDAAVAVAFALNVTQPSAGNIGGGGFMLVLTPDGQSTAIDYREVAPAAARRDMFLDAAGAVGEDSRRGPRAAGIPGVVAGLAMAHAKYGKLPWAELVRPSIELARQGHYLDAFHAKELREALAEVRAFALQLEQDVRELRARGQADARELALLAALRATAETFGQGAGSLPYEEGELWQQPALANTLERLANEGPSSFYSGELANLMATEVQAMGGIWTAQDLTNYRALERAPIRFDYRGHTVITMPPPSAGGVVLRQVLAAAEQRKLHELAWDSPERIHLFVEILRRAYADRNELLGDPAFVQMPITTLLSSDYVARRMADIDLTRATPSSAVRAGLPLDEPIHTTHFSVVDAAGMAVANTYTLNTNFGALVQIPGTGVTLNNEMDDFTAKPGAPNAFGLVQGVRNGIEPGKRMLSSMSPTIVLQGGKLRAVLGSPGGPTITTTVAQVLLQLVDHEIPLDQAVLAPRVHHQWLPDEILFEPALSPAIAARLRALGHKLVEEHDIGHANCIEVERTTGSLRAVADVSRGGGGAAAY
jgi:gamma-glutamyltranspeptidase/glutathione hydrolase